MANRPFFAFHFHKRSNTPLYVQLAEQLRTALLRGAFLVGGEQLISLREMKAVSGCSLETVKKAYDHLVADGWLEAVHGKGYFLTAKAKQARDCTRLPLTDIPLASLVDSTPQPGAELMRRLRVAFYESVGVLLDRPDEKKARRSQAAEVFAGHLARRGIPHVPERLLLFNRSVSGFSFLVQQVMKRTDVVFVEAYSYPAFMAMLRHSGIEVRAIRLDDEGICPEALEAAQRERPADWLMVNPHHHFPTGISYSPRRKRYLLEWAERHGVRLLENDHHGDLWFRRPGRTLYRMAAEAGSPVPVYYLHSFSKTLAPDVQLGVLALPWVMAGEERERLRQFVTLMGAEPPLVVLEAAARLLADPWFAEVYLPERRALFSSRWQCLLQEQRQALPKHARILPISGGLNTWIEWGTASPLAASQEARIVSLLREEGLELMPGQAFRLPDEPVGIVRRPAVRFPLSPLDERELKHWLHRLGAAMLR
jgi:GntR family transcriptional regulator / MocR family aminotransferase